MAAAVQTVRDLIRTTFPNHYEYVIPLYFIDMAIRLTGVETDAVSTKYTAFAHSQIKFRIGKEI